MSFIAGSYQITWNGSALGQCVNGTEFEEPGLEYEEIVGDTFGPNAPQDGVTLGGSCFASFVLMEYDGTAVRSMIGHGYVAGTIPYPGLLVSSLVKQVVWTKVSGSNATPTTRTAPYCSLANAERVRYLLGNRHRVLPIRLRIWPYVDGSSLHRFFTDG